MWERVRRTREFRSVFGDSMTLGAFLDPITLEANLIKVPLASWACRSCCTVRLAGYSQESPSICRGRLHKLFLALSPPVSHSRASLIGVCILASPIEISASSCSSLIVGPRVPVLAEIAPCFGARVQLPERQRPLLLNGQSYRLGWDEASGIHTMTAHISELARAIVSGRCLTPQSSLLAVALVARPIGIMHACSSTFSGYAL